MATPTSAGANRTGMQMSPRDASALMEISEDRPSRPGETLALAEERERRYREASPVGSVPPAASAKGMAKTALQMLKGNKPTVLVDKLGERLAFERMSVRLYETVIGKHEALGGWDGGPSREQLLQIRDEELAHFMLLKETVERLGADPTAMTPGADVAAVESSGVAKVVTDARTTLPEVLHAMLIAEAADTEGWTLLVRLAESVGQDELADRFRAAQAEEERHHEWVRDWLSRAVLADAAREMKGGGH